MKTMTIDSFELSVPDNWQIESRSSTDFSTYLLTIGTDTATIYLGYAPQYPKMQEPIFQKLTLKNYLDSSGIEYDDRLLFADERLTDRNRVQKFNYEYQQINDYWIRIITSPTKNYFRVYIDSLGNKESQKLSLDLIGSDLQESTKTQLLKSFNSMKRIN